MKNAGKEKSILFISYWGLNEGLTQATVLPHLYILAESTHVQQIILVTIERQDSEVLPLENALGDKIIVRSYKSNKKQHVLLTKVNDYIGLPRFLRQLVQTYSIEIIIGRGSPAGNLAWILHRKTGLPFYVESFEPHADYMAESGVWKKWDTKYLLQKRWEKKQKLSASGLMPVSENYRLQLIKEGISDKKIKTIPCNVNLSTFKFNESARIGVRKKHGIATDQIVGIYAGKFGGLYYDAEAFSIFASAFKHIPEFVLIILSPDDKSIVEGKIKKNDLPADKIHFLFVPHKEVPGYLSAADFAFSLHKTTRVSAFFSPIKNGEYWAAGLPVMVPDAVGDDAAIVSKEALGYVFDINKTNWETAFESIYKQVKDKKTKEKAMIMAAKYRSFDSTQQAYSYFNLI